MPIYKFTVRFTRSDPRSVAYLADVHALGFHQLQKIECQDLYFIEGQLSQEDLQKLALKLLADPVTQAATWAEISKQVDTEADATVIEVALRPGVTDPVAHEIVRAAHELGIDGVHRAATGRRFNLQFALSVSPIRYPIQEFAFLFANPIIQHWTLGEIEPSFPLEAESSGHVARRGLCQTIPVRNLTDAELLALSKDRRAALDLAEMKAVQDYCRKENRDLTDVEFETIAQTWSEHCVHKTFKAKIEVTSNQLSSNQSAQLPNYQLPTYPAEINSIIHTYLKTATEKINAPWVISAFVDNAGIIDLDGENEISFKVETHNHPSAVEPFGGANTGVGGVIRDVLGVSHKPIANTDVLCFGKQDATFDQLPKGTLHPRSVMSGVVAGVQDYGNKIGIPTVNGAILFDEGYAANPLVFCGCVGFAPKGLHVSKPKIGDRVIALGGQTGRDGLRGATFSSMTMDAQTGEVAGASVQIGDPITEKGLIDVIIRARDLRLYTAITDCGAGGFSSAVGEMASSIGADVELQNVRLKYAGLAPWEIWLSEAQERMVLAVPPENVAALQELCDTFDTELTDLGEFTGSHRLVVRYAGDVVLDMDNEFLHDGIPQRQLKAVISNQVISNQESPQLPDYLIPNYLINLLSHPNIASKESVIRLYDHEVQGGTVVKPLAGICADAPSDAAVIRPRGAKGNAGIAIANGINPEYGKRDAYRMALAVVDEAIRNLVAVGADPERIAILDNFCWGDPLRPETLGSLVEATRGCHDAAMLYRAPFISGKDSLNNEYIGADGQRHAIPPTLLISSIGVMQDVTIAVSMDLKEAGNALYLVGKFAPAFGGSHLALIDSQFDSAAVPSVDEITPQVYKAIHEAMKAKLIRAAHDLSEGGLAVAAAEMSIGGRLGLDLALQSNPLTLFGETTGCILVEVAPENIAAFKSQFTNLPYLKLGTITTDPTLKLGNTTIPVADLIKAFTSPNS